MLSYTHLEAAMFRFLLAALAAAALANAQSSSSSSTATTLTTYTNTASVGPDGITTVPYPPPTCTALSTNTYAVVDPQQVSYVYMCGGGSGGSAYSQIANSGTWRDCFALCDASAGCTGFSYVQGSANYGESPGQCWLKNTNPNSFASTANLVSTRMAGLVRQFGMSLDRSE